MPRTIVGLFRDPAEADAALKTLERHGFTSEQVSILAYDGSGEFSGLAARERESGAKIGTGAAIGGAAGLMLGVAALAIPGIGPVLAAGPLAAALTGAGVGAAAGGMIGALSGLGVSEHDASYYANELKRGGTLVVVHAGEEQVEEAESILDRHDSLAREARIHEAEQTTGISPHDYTATVGDEGSPSEYGRAQLRRHSDKS